MYAGLIFLYTKWREEGKERGKSLLIITNFYKQIFGLIECHGVLETPRKREKEDREEKKQEKTVKRTYAQVSK